MALTVGRLPAKIIIGEVRPLRRDDLEAIREKRTIGVVQKLRDPHHRAARLIASGLRPQQVAIACGYSMQRIYTLTADPAFKDLVAKYREDVHEAFVSSEEEHYAMATEVNRKALRHINEHFDKADEEGELVPFRNALAAFGDTSDRVGIQKRSTQTHVNVDFAAKLEAAIARSGKANAMVDVTPSALPQSPLRRRA